MVRARPRPPFESNQPWERGSRVDCAPMAQHHSQTLGLPTENPIFEHLPAVGRVTVSSPALKNLSPAAPVSG